MSKIGKFNIISKLASIGEPPQHLGYYKGDHKAGDIEIGGHNIIREYVTIHAPIGKLTKIGNNNFLMAYTHVAHDCTLEDNIVMANGTNLAGHVYVMNNANIGLNTCVHQYSTIGSYSMIGMGSVVTKDIPPFCLFYGGRIHGLNKIGLKRLGITLDDKLFQTEKDRFEKIRNKSRKVYKYEILPYPKG